MQPTPERRRNPFAAPARVAAAAGLGYLAAKGGGHALLVARKGRWLQSTRVRAGKEAAFSARFARHMKNARWASRHGREGVPLAKRLVERSAVTPKRAAIGAGSAALAVEGLIGRRRRRRDAQLMNGGR